MDSASLSYKRINDQFQKRMQVLSALLFLKIKLSKVTHHESYTNVIAGYHAPDELWCQ